MSLDKKHANPRTTANPLSRLFLWWMVDIFSKGFKRKIEEDDLYSPIDLEQSQLLGDKLETNWNYELVQAKAKNRTPSLTNVLVKTFWSQYMWQAFIKTVEEVIIGTVQPLLLGLLLNELDPMRKSISPNYWLYAASIPVSYILSSFMSHHTLKSAILVGMRMRVACCSVMYRKALRLSPQAMAQNTTGMIVNIMSNDVGRFDVVLTFLFTVWTMPIKVAICMYIVYRYMGMSCISGFAFLFLLAGPLQGFLVNRIRKYRKGCAIRTDERMRLMNEIISGIQVIKMYAWEKPFASLVDAARKREVKYIQLSTYAGFFFGSLLFTVERVTLFLILLTYVLLGQKIRTDQIFAVGKYINVINYCMTSNYSAVVRNLSEIQVSIKRIQKFLLQEECLPEMTLCGEADGVVIQKGHAEWSEGRNTLHDIDLKVPRGKLCVISGAVGSGKSSLLHVILGELPLSVGSVSVAGRMSYSSQEAWIYNGTVRDNILFGLPYNTDRYPQVINACALQKDLDMFPHGDCTIVGERGITLSGGQRARLSLARAVYREADVYLLDDPLSAVDVHVGKHLFAECIKKFLRDKTRVLVTHQVQYLKDADTVAILSNGTIVKQGVFDELIHSGMYATLLQKKMNDENTNMNGVDGLSVVNIHNQVMSQSEDDAVQKNKEIQTVGSVSLSCYWQYIRAGNGVFFLSLVMLMMLLSQGSLTGIDYWVMFWTRLNDTSTQSGFFTKINCLYIYGGLVGASVLLCILRTLLFFKTCMKSSVELHNNMFSAVLRTTMTFFDVNPAGRILNRFSKDMGIIDEQLPFSMFIALSSQISLFGVLAMVFLMNYWICIPAVVAAMLFFLITVFYISTARSLKRLEGITRSPVYSHISDSLRGLSIIRASESQERMCQEFDKFQNVHTSAYSLFMISCRAFGLWLDCVCNAFIATVIFIPLLLTDEGIPELALSITQALLLTGMMQFGILQATEMINYMTSVERVLEYTHLASEGELESSFDKKPPEVWPTNGAICFDKVSLTYSDKDNATPPVLKNINFVIQPRHKIGIVGRTGAGKSSLMAALFRLARLHGSVYIDSIDSGQIGLHDLRRKISVIPQEPALFSASLRYNLDPFNTYSDEELWNTLEEVELKNAVSSLDQTLTAGGSNLSVGQRQLVCLARAILRNNRILVLDEATANVDPETDALIQTTIRNKFVNCTVVTIAHRLNTIMDSDMVLVMDSGSLVEYDHPYILLQNPDGYFHHLVHETGASMAAHLAEVAQQAYALHFSSYDRDITGEQVTEI